MNITIYDHYPLAFSAIKGTDGNRVQVLDGESLLTLWLTEEQANALRQALDAIYPPPAPPVQVAPSERCDGVECQSEGPRCGEKGPRAGYLCSRLAKHAGPHIACGTYEHNYEVWPQSPAADLDPGAADALAQYAEEHAGDALTLHGRDQNGEPVTETIKAPITIKAR